MFPSHVPPGPISSSQVSFPPSVVMYVRRLSNDEKPAPGFLHRLMMRDGMAILRLCCIRDCRYDAVGRVSISKGRGDADSRLKSESGSKQFGDSFCVIGDEVRTKSGAGEVAFAVKDPRGDVMLCPMNLALSGVGGISLVGV